MAKKKAKPKRKVRADAIEHATWSDVALRHWFNTIGMLCTTGLLALVFSRCNPKDLPGLVKTTFGEGFGCYIGWAMGLLFLFTTIAAYKITMSLTRNEIDRLCRERDELQERVLGKALRHSGRQ